MLTSCGLFRKYEQKVEAPANAYGIGVEEAVTGSSLAQMSWREFFTDPLLQQLIEQVLANNTDLNSARLYVEMSEASLKAAKLAYLPSLSLGPQGTLSKFDNNPWAKSYNLQM
ncbi:MAG: TolC family protein [Bacteroidaceae bacterium]|nr:TolC family protein [Bacteroidaceae bacterium]